jgi:hypothetical protein
MNVKINYISTLNTQYLYDSHLHPEYFENELLKEYDHSSDDWFNSFIENVHILIENYKIKNNKLLHVGSANGRVTFELAKKFDQVKFVLSFLSN